MFCGIDIHQFRRQEQWSRASLQRDSTRVRNLEQPCPTPWIWPVNETARWNLLISSWETGLQFWWRWLQKSESWSTKVDADLLSQSGICVMWMDCVTCPGMDKWLLYLFSEEENIHEDWKGPFRKKSWRFFWVRVLNISIWSFFA